MVSIMIHMAKHRLVVWITWELLVMDLDDQLSLGPLFLTDRKCRTCGKEKNLIDGFYKKGPGMNPSSYSTELKGMQQLREF